MDYETIVYGNCCCNSQDCYLGCEEISWDRGEITEIELPIFGGFTLDDEVFISVKDFIKGSKTKSIVMILKDHYGKNVNTQEVNSDSKNIEYFDDHISCYYVVDGELSNSLYPGSYTLFVYLRNTVNGKTIFNKLVTSHSGLETTIF